MQYLQASLRLLLILLVVLFSALAIYSYTSADEIKRFLLKEINKQLLVEADVKEVEISLFQNFPNLSLILHQLHMHQDSQSIIKAEEVRVKFSLLDILDREFELHSLSISNGQLDLIEDDKGRFFPQIWNSSNSEDKSQDLSFELKLRKLSLSQIKLQYAEKDADTEFTLLINSAWAKGKFGQDNYELAWNSTISDFDFYKKGEAAFLDQELRLESICVINEKSKKLTVQMLEIDWQNLQLNGKGELDYSDKLIINISFADQATALANYFPLLDSSLSKSLDSLDISGTLKIDGQFKGELAPNFHPSIDIVYHIDNGSFIDKEKQIELKSLMGRGKYINPDLSKASNGNLFADTLSGLLNELDLSGRLMLSSTTTFPLSLQLELKGELRKLNSYLNNNDLELTEGNFTAKFEGEFATDQLNDFSLKEWKSAEKSLYIKLEDAAIAISDSFPPIHSINGELALGRNDLFAESFTFETEGMQLSYRGSVLNLISFLDDENEMLLIDGQIKSQALDIEKIMGLFPENQLDTISRDYRYRMYLDAKLSKLKYQKLLMKDVELKMKADEGRWMFEQISMKTLNGKLEGDLLFQEGLNDSWLMYSQSDFEKMDIHILFEVFDNFGQEEIQAKNLYGSASGFLELECEIVEGKVEKQSLKANGYFDILNGRLVEYQSLYQLAKYIELEELKEIKFSRLRNQFQIQNENIYLPRFSVNSSAIDLEIEGNHSFSNQVDYHIGLELAQVLGKKVKKPKENDFGYVEDDGLGKTRLFLRMQGDINNPSIKYDKQQLKAHWKNEVKKEKQSLKSILNEEFGLFKKDTSLSKPGNKSEEKPPFQIEWGESEQAESKQDTTSSQSAEKEEKNARKKGKFGKFIDKIAKPNEDEYVYPQD